MRVEVKAEAKATEAVDKVCRAIQQLFDVEVSLQEVGYTRIIKGLGDHRALYKFRRRLREQRILDAARQFLYRGKEEGYIRFYLNKQAAYMGRISFCTYEYGESPLGAITVNIETNDPDTLIAWLAPRTVRGVPVEEVEEPPDP